MAFINIIQSSTTGIVEIQFHSFFIDHIYIFDWLRFVQPDTFFEIEITKRSSLTPSTRVWLSVVLYCHSNNSSCESIFEKTFRNSFLREYFILMYVDEKCARYDLKPAMKNLCARFTDSAIYDCKLDLKPVFVERQKFSEHFDYDLERVKFQIALSEEQHKNGLLKKEFDDTYRQTDSNGQKININHRDLVRMGTKYGVDTGHWQGLFHESEAHFIFETIENWNKLLISFLFGHLSSIDVCFRIGSKLVENGGIFLLVHGKCSVLNASFQNMRSLKEIFRLEKLIRYSRIFKILKYKFDVYSICEIRRGNEFLRPTVLKSLCIYKEERLLSNNVLECDPLPTKSQIDSDYSANHSPPEEFDFRNRSWENVLHDLCLRR